MAGGKVVGIRAAMAFGALVAFEPPQLAQAWGTNVNASARSGVTTRIVAFFDCVMHVPFQGSAFVEHGSLTYKETKGNFCGNPNEPVREVWYTSNPGFVGVDKAVFPLGGASIATATIAVVR
jgi:hypothetical protein